LVNRGNPRVNRDKTFSVILHDRVNPWVNRVNPRVNRVNPRVNCRNILVDRRSKRVSTIIRVNIWVNRVNIRINMNTDQYSGEYMSE
jgi:hypothetical protein